MSSGKMCSGSGCLLRRATLLLLAIAMLLVVGCAPLSKSRARVSVQRYPSSVGKSSGAVVNDNSSSLAAIVNHEIQHGHYAEGEIALRQYLAEHPADGSAQAMLHQLTVDPIRMLGSEARDYMVRPGDSYSSLAAHYLGDASLFVVLARYNRSGNPSNLRVGQRLRIPLSHGGAEAMAVSPLADPSPMPETRPRIAAMTYASPEAKASRLQDESVALFKEGKKQNALDHLDQALLISPTLKSNGAIATSLRQQLVANDHERAVVLYRDQKLDPAIALWDRVLAIDPQFEPAVIYRTRALELKRRLKQF